MPPPWPGRELMILADYGRFELLGPPYSDRGQKLGEASGRKSDGATCRSQGEARPMEPRFQVQLKIRRPAAEVFDEWSGPRS